MIQLQPVHWKLPQAHLIVLNCELDYSKAVIPSKKIHDFFRSDFIRQF